MLIQYAEVITEICLFPYIIRQLKSVFIIECFFLQLVYILFSLSIIPDPTTKGTPIFPFSYFSYIQAITYLGGVKPVKRIPQIGKPDFSLLDKIEFISIAFGYFRKY